MCAKDLAMARTLGLRIKCSQSAHQCWKNRGLPEGDSVSQRESSTGAEDSVVQLCECPNDSRVEALRNMKELHAATDIASLNQLLISSESVPSCQGPAETGHLAAALHEHRHQRHVAGPTTVKATYTDPT